MPTKPIARLKIIPCAVTFSFFFSLIVILKILLFAVFGITIITVNAIDGTYFVQFDELIGKSFPIAVQKLIELIFSSISGFIFGFIFAISYNLFVRITNWHLLQASLRE